MSRKAVEAVVAKMLEDEKFRFAVMANPDEAYAGYDLSEQEVAALKKLDAETIENMAGQLDERVSKATLVAEMLGGF